MATAARMLRTILARGRCPRSRLVGVVVVTFMLTRVLPGDTAAYFAGPAATPQAIAQIRTHLGPRPAAAASSSSAMSATAQGRSRQVADHRAAGRDRHRGAAAGLGRADAAAG